jgi:glycosyltransferase involved in cell wall biosynthesis
MRIAFVTNEFVIEKPDAGGLGNYLYRITKLLHESGHDVELFVTRHKIETPRVINFNGIRVEHVPVAKKWYLRILRYIDNIFIKTPYSGLPYNLGVPLSLSWALESRHREKPFDVVQSANVSCAGLFIKKRKSRKHVVRLSSIVKNNLTFDGHKIGIGARLLIYLQHLILLKADKVYAPSLLTAETYKQFLTPKIHLVRPPFFIENYNQNEMSVQLPNKYLIHFGSVGFLKGSDIIANALIKVWDAIPDFKMIWVGKERVPREMEKYYDLWGDKKSQILWIEGLKKNELYATIKGAIASVLPSRVDNLPNTVIESLFLKVPVIGSNGASIDEIVIHKRNGVLIEIGDVNQLAQYMIEAWLDINQLLPKGFQDVAELEPFSEVNAYNNLIDFYNN